MLRLFTAAETETRADHPEPELRGRRYAVPFARVWEAALYLVDGGIAGWCLTDADEDTGRATGEVASSLTRQLHDVAVHVWLDTDGQTCLDARCRHRTARGDLGTSRRHVVTFLRSLDRHLGV